MSVCHQLGSAGVPGRLGAALGWVLRVRGLQVAQAVVVAAAEGVGSSGARGRAARGIQGGLCTPPKAHANTAAAEAAGQCKHKGRHRGGGAGAQERNPGPPLGLGAAAGHAYGTRRGVASLRGAGLGGVGRRAGVCQVVG